MKIFCITNAREGASRESEAGPGFYMKPDTALLRNNDPFFVPEFSGEVEAVCRPVVKIGRVGRAIAPRFAHRYYNEVGLGVCFTARDVLRRAIAEGRPWDSAVAFDRSAALSPEFVPVGEAGEMGFEMSIGGRVVQRGRTSEAPFTVDEIIAHISRFVTLKIGDLIYMGAPGDGNVVVPGDRISARLEGREMLNFAIK